MKNSKVLLLDLSLLIFRPVKCHCPNRAIIYFGGLWSINISCRSRKTGTKRSRAFEPYELSNAKVSSESQTPVLFPALNSFEQHRGRGEQLCVTAEAVRPLPSSSCLRARSADTDACSCLTSSKNRVEPELGETTVTFTGRPYCREPPLRS